MGRQKFLLFSSKPCAQNPMFSVNCFVLRKIEKMPSFCRGVQILSKDLIDHRQTEIALYK